MTQTLPAPLRPEVPIQDLHEYIVSYCDRFGVSYTGAIAIILVGLAEKVAER